MFKDSDQIIVTCHFCYKQMNKQKNLPQIELKISLLFTLTFPISVLLSSGYPFLT